ncbi:ankyrin repeat protein [Metarhizium guizhouense ARSEF 977]|uniref:protein S-acyltransferase n=1 Tax=Metarhizium guizhouense (strain ARSEF 977) TaxID=1276136 RepID=A0A0B4GLP3_METGA|nr:ankyrin repeat protein [Metarhizium guizhouense ARSEF 977]
MACGLSRGSWVRPRQGKSAYLTYLPPEIICMVVRELPAAGDKAALYRTCAALHIALVEEELFRHPEPRDVNDILNWAVERACLRTARRAVAYGADAEASRRSDRETPLMTACRGGNLDMVRLLVEAGADANNRFSRDGSTPVVLSAGAAHDEAVVFLMAHGGDPARRNRYGETALHLAARKNNLRLVRILLASGGVDVNAASVTRSTPLFEAIQVGNVQMVEVLLAYGASEEIDELNGGFVFTKALKSRGTSLMKALLELRIRPDVADAKGRTALSWAAEYGHAMQVEMLLESGAGVDTQDAQGKTPLMYAAVEARIQVMETLLDRGASLTISDRYGMKAACHAVQSENWQSVGLILDRGEDVLCGAGRCARLLLQMAGQKDNMGIVC